ncbi:MAG: hypothetical protein H6978_10660 [Gammaproteobacteria bacterium]|nr:hypothetical protein [Gammaproteobacteria bacterium]
MLLTAMHYAIAEDTANLKAPASQRNFVTCPIIMDTEDVPCWVAEYEGERYYLTVQTGRGGGATVFPFAGMVNHEMLVEGTVTDEPRICGGIVLREAKLSPMTDVTPGCGKVVPGEGYRTKGPRPIGPDGDPPGPRETTAIRVSRGPSRDELAAAYAAAVEKRAARTFQVNYFFDSNYLPFPLEQRTVDEAARYAAEIDASKVKITGYRGRTVLSTGGVVEEQTGLARARAQKIADIFAFFEFPADRMEVAWNEAAEDQGGVRDFELRRATIEVLP